MRPREFGCLVAAIVVMALVLTGLGVGLEAAGLQWYAPWREDRRTEVTRNTNQYVTTQQQAILGLLQAYQQAEVNLAFWQGTPTMQTTIEATRGQQLQKVRGMCDAAARIDDPYVPSEAKPLMRQVGCWNGN